MTETFLDGRVRVRQSETGFRAGLDAVMLAAAVPAMAGQSAFEPGAGAGTASLCLAARVPGLVITGIEIDSGVALLANENAQANAMPDAHFVEGDIFALPLELKREFDHVLINPPFHGAGQSPPDATRARALKDEGRLGDWLQAGLKRTVSGGVFTAILRADRLGEAMAVLPQTGMIAFPLWPKEGEAAKRVILQLVKGSGAALILSPGLVLHHADGTWTPAADAILRGGAALALTDPLSRFRPIPGDKIVRKAKTFQDLILTLQNFWASKGCLILQPYDNEMGAGTSHPATLLRALGPRPWKAAYVQPSRRPSDGRYGENPNRLQHYYQYQVILKPAPANVQELYLESIKAIGLDPALHDIRFVEDDWENPTLGAWGLGWEVWCDGMEITQFTYFQQVGGIECDPVAAEITYGLERLAMYVQNVEFVYDLAFNDEFRYGEVFHQNEQEFSAYNFEKADTEILFRHFKDAEKQCGELLDGDKKLPLPAYDQCLKAAHAFNLLDARGVISVTERAAYIGRVRTLAKACCEAWLQTPMGAYKPRFA